MRYEDLSRPDQLLYDSLICEGLSPAQALETITNEHLND